MHDAARLRNLDLFDGAIAAAVGVHQTVLFQARQPCPFQRANQFEIRQTTVPTIKNYTAWDKAARFGSLEHLLKMIVLGQAISGLVKEAVVTRDVAVAIAPQESDEVDARDDISMFARPVARDQFNLASV